MWQYFNFFRGVGSVLFWSEGLSSEDMIKVIQKEKNSH
jgi:hypothetical protein